MNASIAEAARLLVKMNIRAAAEEPLAGHTSFRIGGPADLAVFPSDASQICACVAALEGCGVPFFIVGRGTNLLFSDAGLRGAAIITAGDDSCSVRGNRIVAPAGCRLSAMASKAAAASLTGLEFAHGIPGTVGGGVFMNAGAYGGQLSDRLVSVTLLDREKMTVSSVPAERLELSYRHSLLQERSNLMLLEAEFEAEEGDPESIYALMKELASKRREKQPLEYPSAGSVFKRPAPDMYVGKMIEEAGLKGCRVGGAEVSVKHAGFIVNRGGATCSDVLRLIEKVQDTLERLYGVRPECEIRTVPEELA